MGSDIRDRMIVTMEPAVLAGSLRFSEMNGSLTVAATYEGRNQLAILLVYTV